MERIMFAGDLHKRAKDITTIEGYVNCTLAVQRALMQEIQNKGVTKFVSLGDWYDRGYSSDIAASLSDYDIDIKMSELLHGEFYGVIGNHIRLSLDSNPELHLIQPHPVFKSRRVTARDNQIIRTPRFIRVGDVQISLMHNYSDTDDVMEYKPVRQPWARYHVAVFHTELVIPNSVLVGTAYGYSHVTNSKIAEVLSDVDLAIVGHVHDAIGKVMIDKPDGSKTVMIIPGSLTNVNAGEQGRHSYISIPILTIEDNGEIKLEFLPFDLKLNMVTFKKKNLEESREKLRSLKGKPVDQLTDAVTSVAAITCGNEVLSSLNAFMRAKGYSDKDKKLVRAILNDPANIGAIVDIYLS